MSAATKISAVHPFLNSAVIINLSNSVMETLLTMANLGSRFEKGFIERDWISPSEISAFLELESATSCGQLRFHFTRNALTEIYRKMMDEEPSGDVGEIFDLVGEISNMCYGQAKGKLNSQGYKLNMSIPKAAETSQLPQKNSSHPNLIVPFKVLNETCYIQIIIG